MFLSDANNAAEIGNPVKMEQGQLNQTLQIDVVSLKRPLCWFWFIFYI